MEEIIKYLTFKGYLEYKDKFKPNSIIGKLILINPEIKKDIKSVISLINKILEEAKKSEEEKIYRFIEENKYLEEKINSILNKSKKDDKKELPELNLEVLKNSWFDKFRTRFEPSPSGPLHIGHAIGVITNYLYAKKYSGDFILRIADTNPKNILAEAYDYIVEDVEFLTGKRIKPIIQSKRIQIYYEKVEELLKKGLAYVALYDKKEKEYFQIGKLKLDKTILQRDRPIEENLELWEKMLNNEFREGEAIVRIKTTINKDPNEKLDDVVNFYKNSSLIDFPIFRIVEEEHPIMENIYVWPLMNFSVAIDDALLKVSHVIRGKDHELNGKKQELIYNYLNLPKPEFIYFGRINFIDLKVSTSQTKKAILEGKFEGWDDLRLPFIRALKRRGIQREALQKYVLNFGISKSDKKTTMEEFFQSLYKFNREILDPITNRYFLVENPVKIKIPIEREIKIKKRPNSNEERIIKVNEEVYINGKLLEELYNKGINKVRLMHLITIEFEKVGDNLIIKNISDEIPKYKIEWVSTLNSEEIVLLKLKNNNITREKVIVEKEALMENIFQAERLGFIKNEKEKEQLIFMHR